MKPSLAIVLHDPDDAALLATRRATARLTGRHAEAIAARGKDTPGALRNRAVADATADYLAFVIDPPRSSFLDVAARLLDGDPDVAFVTGWGDAVPSRHDPSPHPAALAALCGRSWFSHVPALYRRSAIAAAGGFDETLPGAEELDLLLRLVTGGARGLVVEEPTLYHRGWGPSAAPNSGEPFDRAGRRLFEKHRALFEAHLAAILVARERTVRELVDRVALLKRRAVAR